MMRPLFLIQSAGVATALALGPLSAAAQDDSLARVSPTPLLPPPAIDDLLSWKSIASPIMSTGGEWFGYTLELPDGNSELILRRLADGREFSFPTGANRGSALSFGQDGRTATFLEWPPLAEIARLELSGEAISPSANLASLTTGQVTRFERARASVYSGGGGGRWLVVHIAPSGNAGASAAARSAAGSVLPSDLLLYEIPTGARHTINGVTAFLFDSTGRRLFYTVQADSSPSSAIVLRDMTSGLEKRLDESDAEYRHLQWDEPSGGLLSATKIAHGATPGDAMVEFVWFTGFARNTPRRQSYIPRNHPAFPSGMVVAVDVRHGFTDDRSGIYFSVREEENAPHVVNSSAEPRQGGTGSGSAAGAASGAAGAAGAADVIIWRNVDERRRQPHTRNDQAERQAGYRMLFRVAARALIQLEDSIHRGAVVTARDRWALVIDSRTGEQLDVRPEKRLIDVHVVDLRSGSRRMALMRTGCVGAPSPDGQHFFFHGDGHYFVYDLASGQSRNITEGVATSFAGEDSHGGASVLACRGPVWAADSRSVLISDGWDLWSVPITGTRALNLSVNGKTDSVRYGAILFRDKHASGVDLRRPVFLTAIGEWSKREGVARIDPRRPGAVRVLFEEARIKMGKAPGADVYFYSRETAFEFPDYYVANSNLASGVRVTRANSLQSGFAWSDSTQLLDFTSPAGTRLQAALHLPAGHDSAGRYPLLVFLDTAGSRALHSYLGNGRGTPFIPALYTSRGYAVLVPDIGIRVNDPGAAALESVTSALTAALATGTVDRERVAIVGHGWGGYLASFVLTQTERFSAAVLSAPVTNLVSLFSSESPNRSEAGAALDDRIARRFSSSFWDSSAVFVRNSPLAHAARMETPLLLVHNDEDELVPFTQGVELYNALRTLGKPVVLLQYQGERNSLELARNKVDFSLRMMQFLDHHLMGADAPAWWDFAPRR